MHHPPQNDVVDLTNYTHDMDDQLQQAIAASLLDVCCPNGDVKISVELQAQQLKEFEYYQRRQSSSWLGPAFTSVLKAESELDSQIKINCWESMGSEFAKKPTGGEQAATPHEKDEEGSQASTTSAESSLSAHETSGHTPDNSTLSSMETPKAAEARLPAMGFVNPGPQSQSRVATWPTAAVQLMGAPKLQGKSARPPSPSGSTGSFSNKRRKLVPSDTLLGLAKGTTAWQASQPSDDVPTKQPARPASDNSNAGVALDADSDPPVAGGASQHCNAGSSLTQDVLSSHHFTDQRISTAAPDLLASTEQLPTEAGDPVDIKHDSVYSNQSPVDDDNSSDANVPICRIDYQYHQAKGKQCIGPSPLLQYDPEQESKLDHIRTGNWVWWRMDSTWTFARVEARFCNYFGLVHEYRVSVLDEINGNFPVDGVPPDQICMHFFPGSRVIIKQKKVQGEVLPIQYRQLFDGFYTVKLDEGAEEQVAHCDMCLLYNDAEASSWVRCAQTCLSPENSDIAGLQDSALQQQQQQQQHQGGILKTNLGQDITSLGSPDVLLCTPATTTADLAAHTRRTGVTNTAPDIATAAVNSSSPEEEAEQQVVPQLRRTKRTVAQKRLASSVSQAMGDPPSADGSVQRKLSHTQHFEASDRPAASVKEGKSSAYVLPASTAIKNGYRVSPFEQKRHGPQLNALEHDSDEDLFVDLSRANIKSRLVGLRVPQQSLTFVKSVTSPCRYSSKPHTPV